MRVLHAIRKEMASVVKHDFDDVPVQYQIDLVQAVFHLPERNHKEIAKRAVDCAIGLESSMGLVIKKLLRTDRSSPTYDGTTRSRPLNTSKADRRRSLGGAS